MDGTALLLVFMNPPADDLTEWNAWYDDEHVPNRLATPGILSGGRYSAVWETGPRYMAVYDLASLETLQTPEYKRLGAERSEREKAQLARTPMADRRVFRVVQGAPASAEPPPFQLSVAMDPAVDGAADYLAWYAEEHIPMLLEVPGWRRVRVFEQVDGNGPRFLALHELESPAVFDEKAYKEATSTPWRDRVIAGVTRRERSLFKRYVRSGVDGARG
jgi:hypothetical protein